MAGMSGGAIETALADAHAHIADTSVPVVRCATTKFGAGYRPPAARLPHRVAVAVSGDLGKSIAAYSDTAGMNMLLAPRGWTCSAIFGTDGSGGLIVYPKSGPVPGASWGPGWALPRDATNATVTAIEPGVSPVQAAGLACSFFPVAADMTRRDLGHGCGPRPSGQTTRRVSATVVDFEDPAGRVGIGISSGGRNRAIGVVIYRPRAAPGAYLMTCTLPIRERDVCSAATTAFASRYSGGAGGGRA